MRDNAGDIPAFVMYCVNGASCSSLLIESTDSMKSTDSMIIISYSYIYILYIIYYKY